HVEDRASDKADRTDRHHHRDESVPGERAMRRDPRRENGAVRVGFGIGRHHAGQYRGGVAKAQHESAPLRKSPARRSPAPSPMLSPDEVEGLFGRLRDADPEPKSELKYTNPFTLLVAVALSAQATDIGVNRATGPLFAVADTPEKMLALGEDELRE